MSQPYLAEFQDVYLEGSYLLGFACEGRDIHLDVLFALTKDHPEYASPEPGEQHCYRRGKLVLGEPSVSELKSGLKPTVSRNPDGTLDLGGIELFRKASGEILIETEWFKLAAEERSLSVSIMRNVRYHSRFTRRDGIERIIVVQRDDSLFTYQKQIADGEGTWGRPGPACGVYDSPETAIAEAQQRVWWLKADVVDYG